jgi:hypothetical protein
LSLEDLAAEVEKLSTDELSANLGALSQAARDVLSKAIGDEVKVTTSAPVAAASLSLEEMAATASKLSTDELSANLGALSQAAREVLFKALSVSGQEIPKEVVPGIADQTTESTPLEPPPVVSASKSPEEVKESTYDAPKAANPSSSGLEPIAAQQSDAIEQLLQHEDQHVRIAVRKALLGAGFDDTLLPEEDSWSELSKLRQGELQRRARIVGVSDDEIDDAIDQGNAKAALIELSLAQPPREAADGESPSAGPALARSETQRVRDSQVPLTWDTPEGEQIVFADRAPLGVNFEREHMPLSVTGVRPESQAVSLGIQPGWRLHRVDGVDITSMATFELCFHELVHALQPKEEVTLLWGTPGGDRTIHARRAPLGVNFKNDRIPMVVTSVNTGSQAEEHGIDTDWILKNVDGIDITRMASFEDGFNTLLHELKPVEKGKVCQVSGK